MDAKLKNRSARSIARSMRSSERPAVCRRRSVAARRVEPFAKRRDVGRVAGEELRIGRAAAGPDELRRLEVGEIHHQRGRKRIEAERLVGPVLEHALDDELARADRDRGADVGAEAREQPVLEPDAARGRRAGHRIAARRGDGVGEPHLAAQRITLAHGIEARELARVARDDDRRKGRELRGSQVPPLGLGEVVGVQRVAAAQAQVRGDHAGRLLRDARAHAVDEEADARDRRHRDRERDHEHRQPARA